MAVSQFGGLLLDIQANTASMKRDMETNTRTLTAAAGKMDRIAKGIGAAIGAYVGMSSVRAFGNFVQGALDSADSLSKMSQKTGIAVETLSGLKHAASLSDVSMDQLATGLKLLAKNAAEAAAGGKEQSATFKAMGIDVRDAGGNLKPIEVLLGEVADRFASYEDGAAKSALAQRVFGKAGADLIPLLNSGAAGLAAMREEAERLGIVVSSETAAAAERFNDNMTRVKSQLDAVAMVIAEAALPSLERISDALVDSAKNGDDARETLRTMFDGAIETGMFFKTILVDIGSGIGALAASASQFNTDTWQHPGMAFWENWVGSDSAWMRAMAIQDEAKADSEKRWADFYEWLNRKATGTAASVAGATAGMSIMPADAPAGAEFGMSFVGMPGATTAAPVVPSGSAAKQKVYQAGEALKQIATEVRQLGMTDSQKRLDDFLALKPRTVAEIERYQAALAAIEADTKKVAAYNARVEGKTAVQDTLAGVIEQTDTAGMDEYQRARYGYYQQGYRTAEDDAEFERRLEQLRRTNEALAEMQAKQSAVASAASTLGSTVTSMLLAPLQEGFQGLKTILEMVKAAFLDLIASIMQELAKGIAIKFLSSVLGIPVAKESKGLLATIFGFADGGRVEVANGLALPAFAGGGKFRAPGGPRGDRGVGLFSNDEWNIQASASRYYGDAIMGAINRMAIPRSSLAMAMGGGGAGGGPGRAGSMTVNIQALDPLAVLDVVRDVVAPALGRHLSADPGLLGGRMRAATALPGCE